MISARFCSVGCLSRRPSDCVGWGQPTLQVLWPETGHATVLQFTAGRCGWRRAAEAEGARCYSTASLKNIELSAGSIGVSQIVLVESAQIESMDVNGPVTWL